MGGVTLADFGGGVAAGGTGVFLDVEGTTAWELRWD